MKRARELHDRRSALLAVPPALAWRVVLRALRHVAGERFVGFAACPVFLQIACAGPRGADLPGRAGATDGGCRVPDGRAQGDTPMPRDDNFHVRAVYTRRGPRCDAAGPLGPDHSGCDRGQACRQLGWRDSEMRPLSRRPNCPPLGGSNPRAGATLSGRWARGSEEAAGLLRRSQSGARRSGQGSACRGRARPHHLGRRAKDLPTIFASRAARKP